MNTLPERYTIISTPEEGGFARVYKCKDHHLERVVAIKFIQDKSEINRLLDEIRALLQMRSKHVVQVYDFIPSEHDDIGIVEEYIEGEDLWDSDFPRQSSDNFLKTIWQIAAGIADIHAAGVIHRDIKPNNMKLDVEGIVKIFDFGLSRDSGHEAKTLGFKGTPGFAAPELFGSETVAFTSAIDTYAFAATVIFLACQDLPSSMKKIPPDPITDDVFSRLPIKIPVELVELLNNCLDYEPENRPSMMNVSREIARHLLRDKHQALAVYNGIPFLINDEKRSAGLDYPGVGNIEIAYDGLKFFVKVVVGEVFINNSAAVDGQEIPGSCVVALGGPYRKNDRLYITFDISNPEVML